MKRELGKDIASTSMRTPADLPYRYCNNYHSIASKSLVYIFDNQREHGLVEGNVGSKVHLYDSEMSVG